MSIVGAIEVRRTKERTYADFAALDLKIHDRVVAQIENRLEVGWVCGLEQVNKDVKPEEIAKVLRIVNAEDEKQIQENLSKNCEAREVVIQKVEAYELDMKLICVDYSFDRSKLFIYYTSETKIDFRELIKDLGHILKTRIQMVQIGQREAAKIIGGIGHCGFRLCCETFLKDFKPVSIDMAKEQDLSSGIAKISGVCGKLMCCLAYEYPVYHEAKKHLPAVNKQIDTAEGPAIVKSVNCITSEIVLEYPEGVIKKVKAEELK